MRKLILNRIPYHRGQRKLGVSQAHHLITYMIHRARSKKVGAWEFIMNHVNDDIYEVKKHITAQTATALLQYKKGDLLINIGGDHTIAMGTIPPIMRLYPETKVLWIDAHADINSPQSSSTGNMHGMPVHFLLADGDITPDKLFYYGIRDLDPYEKKKVERDKIRYLTSDQIEANSNDAVLEWIGNSPVHISLDVDGIDPSFIPCTGTPVDNGLDLWSTLNLLKRVKSQMVSIDLVEFNPMLGSSDDLARSLGSIERIVETII